MCVRVAERAACLSRLAKPNSRRGRAGNDRPELQRLLQPSALEVALHVHALCCLEPASDPSLPQSDVPAAAEAPKLSVRSQLVQLDVTARLALVARLVTPLLKQAQLAARGHALLCWALTGWRENDMAVGGAAVVGGAFVGVTNGGQVEADSSTGAASGALHQPPTATSASSARATAGPFVAVSTAELEPSVAVALGDCLRALVEHMASHAEQSERSGAYRTMQRLLWLWPPAARLDLIADTIRR